MAEEKIFLDEKGVKVTSARFITFGKTHSMSGVTAVSSFVINPNRKGPIILAVVGLLAFFIGWIYAIIIIGLAAAWWFTQKKKYVVSLSSASGSEDALTNLDQNFIFRVVDALNEAIVHRG
jgi:hypothetical protein